ncbi:MAG: RNA-binding protein [Methanomassiliicoccaceae archaeon]|nr:RNA-binding protein [Methanomassiliicoccaceae archaeon]
MADIPDIVAEVNERMDMLEKKREISIAASRSIIRLTKRAIHAIHTDGEHKGPLNDAVSEFKELLNSIQDEPEIMFSGPVSDAMAELTEACILSSIVTDTDVPSHKTLNVTPQSWAMGLADCLGELRRILLAHLMCDRTDDARRVFDVMETVCDSVLSFDIPDAILPIRRKQDVARSVMERTRTDITHALIMKRN